MKTLGLVALLVGTPLIAAVGHNCPSIKDLYKDNTCCDEPEKVLAPVHSMDSTVFVIFETEVKDEAMATALITAPGNGLRDGWATAMYPSGAYVAAYTTDEQPNCGGELCLKKGTNLHTFPSLEAVKTYFNQFKDAPEDTITAFCSAFRWPRVTWMGPGAGSEEFKQWMHDTLVRWRPLCPDSPGLTVAGCKFLGTATEQTVLPPNRF